MIKVVRHMITAYLFLWPYLNTNAQELRLGIDYDKRILPKLEIDSKAQLRKIMNQSSSLYSIFQAGLTYEISENISLSGSIRYSSASGEFDDEIIDEINEKIRYTADLKLRTKQFNNDITIKNRIRYQHSAIIADDDRDYIRDKFSIEYKLTRGMKPYVAVEPYLILEEKRIRKLRFYMGSEFELSDNEFELCFILEGKFKDEVIFVRHKVGIFYIF